jgi:prolyl-tRNA editing enzyme YbaK/EbsC (Cys-tRNA(Pro) deacylase)
VTPIRHFPLYIVKCSQLAEHPIHKQIIDLLQQHNCWFEEFHHESVRTSHEAAAVRDGYMLQQGAKAIIIRTRTPNEGNVWVMLVVPGDQRFDGAKVKRVLGAKDIRFASEDEVEAVTAGIKPGGIPPFGNLFNLQVISDRSLYDHEKIIFNAGRTSSIGMKSADFKKLVQPVVTNIVQ